MLDPQTRPPRYRLPRSARLARQRDYRRVFDARCSAADGRLIVYAAANEAGLPRLGLAVPTRVGNAPARSRWRRLIREAFRLQQHDLPAGYDYVVIPRAGGQAPFDELRGSLRRLAQQAAAKFARKAAAEADAPPQD